jgi:polysaccharide export outer membrane protein
MPTYKFKGNSTILLVGLAIALLILNSCANPRKFFYFNDLPKDSTKVHLPDMPWPVSVIQKDDILEIKITGRNEAMATDLNKKGGSFGGGAETVPQYLVNKDGEVDFYLIGKIKVEGLTVDEAKEKITKAVSKYLVEAVVNVRIINFRFTILGEVTKPGTYAIPNERVSILEAMGYAGDMTYLSSRGNVKIYRDSAGSRDIGIVDFNKKSLLSSPYFYLKRNDVIVVDTNIKMKQTNDAFSRAALVIGILSSVLGLYYIFKK